MDKNMDKKVEIFTQKIKETIKPNTTQKMIFPIFERQPFFEDFIYIILTEMNIEETKFKSYAMHRFARPFPEVWISQFMPISMLKRKLEEFHKKWIEIVHDTAVQFFLEELEEELKEKHSNEELLKLKSLTNQEWFINTVKSFLKYKTSHDYLSSIVSRYFISAVAGKAAIKIGYSSIEEWLEEDAICCVESEKIDSTFKEYKQWARKMRSAQNYIKYLSQKDSQ